MQPVGLDESLRSLWFGKIAVVHITFESNMIERNIDTLKNAAKG